MELLRSDLPQNHRLVIAGDLHLGTAASHLKGWERLIARIQEEPNSRLLLMGDMVEAICVDDWRWSAEVHDGKLTPVAQIQAVIDSLRPIKKQVIACLTGNHELKLSRYGDLTRLLCDALDIPYGGYSSKIEVRCKGSRAYKLYATHGRLAVNSTADDPLRRLSNQKLTLKRRLQHLAGDCAVMVCGHSHKLLSIPPEAELYMTDDGMHLHAHYTQGVQHGAYIDPSLRWYGNTGSFLKSAIVGAISYSEAGMFSPVQMGYLELVVKAGQIVGLEETHIGAN